MKKKTASDAVKILRDRYIKGHRRRIESVEKERENLEIAEQIFALRSQAGLTQEQLAKKVGTTQSVISRLEDADYNAHTLAMLRRIATALNQQVEVRFAPRTANYAFA
jgi:DNA-binding XRE family transcriptional regulator